MKRFSLPDTLILTMWWSKGWRGRSWCPKFDMLLANYVFVPERTLASMAYKPLRPANDFMSVTTWLMHDDCIYSFWRGFFPNIDMILSQHDLLTLILILTIASVWRGLLDQLVTWVSQFAIFWKSWVVGIVNLSLKKLKLKEYVVFT